MRFLRLLILAAFAAPAFADDFVEWVGANSGVNWSAGQIQAEGVGVGPDGAPPSMARMMSCRAAIVDAQRNLLESIQGVRVESTTVVADMMVESDVIKTSVNGVLQGGQVIKREPQDDGSCVITMTAPLAGKFTTDVYSQVFSPEETAQTQSAIEIFSRLVDSGLDFLIPKTYAQETGSLPEWKAAFDQLSARITSIEDLLETHPAVVEVKDTGPTGLVLDARGSNFIPSMSPKIRMLRAGIIYPNAKHQVDRRDRGQLVSLFTRDLDTAKRHPAVGERPIVLKGLRTWGETRTEIVLGSESGGRLDTLVKEGFLDDAGVIIVL